MKILVVGKSARLDAIISSLSQSRHKPEIYAATPHNNISINSKTKDVYNGKDIISYARYINPDLVVIGPEDYLAEGIVDKLECYNIPCIGPKKEAAKIEYSKTFARDLISKLYPNINPKYKVFGPNSSVASTQIYMLKLGSYVVKPDGLTGGKGVRIYKNSLNIGKSLNYCQEISKFTFIIEEKLIGKEFSLHTFCDGINYVHAPVVQDYKRLLEGDQGPNTGGMGSISYPNHSMPFLPDNMLKDAQYINEGIAHYLNFTGILYGNYMVTPEGLKLIEFNSRFGDPEVMNILALMDTDLVEVFEAMKNQELNKIDFKKEASVCIYLVPEGYPDSSRTGNIEIKNVPVLFGAVDSLNQDTVITKNSRALALVRTGNTLEETTKKIYLDVQKIKGDFFYRKDIGKIA